MASIICGNCSQRHTSVRDVKDCHDGYSAEIVTRSNLDPTPKQLDFAHGLLRTRVLMKGSPLLEMSDQQAHEFVNAMSKPEISEFISEMVNRPRRTERETTERISVDEGMYRLDGDIFKVQKAIHGSGHLYAKVLSEAGFRIAPGMVARLRPEHKMTLDEAKEYGVLYGSCCVCGRGLTNEDSIAAGIGPVCAAKKGWFATA